MTTGALFTSVGSAGVEESFSLRAAAAGGFGAVTAALARKLAWVAEQPGQHSVILEVPDGALWPYYVQAAIDAEDGAWVEAVSNGFIDRFDALLDHDQLARLAELGFTPPGESPNHHRHFPTPVDWASVARLFVETLTSVYGVSEDDEIELRVYPLVRNEEAP